MKSLNKADETLLLDGVKRATDLVDNQGFTPTEALHKVALDLKYSPGFLKAACNAFNNGRQVAQWEANEAVLDKLASFELANYDQIHAHIWGEREGKVASHSLLPPSLPSYEDLDRQALLEMELPGLEKADADDWAQQPLAADELAGIKIARQFSRLEFAQREAEEARREKSAAEDRLHLKLHLLENYFSKFAYERHPLAQVEAAAAVCYGEPGAALMEYMASRFPQEKRAADHQPSWQGFNQAVDRSQEPYTLIEAAIKQAEAYHQAQARLQEATEKAAQAREFLASFHPPQSDHPSGSLSTPTPSSMTDDSGAAKEASIMSGLAGGFGLGTARALGAEDNDARNQAMEEQIKQLDSPDHLNELRKIRAQTVLTQLMSDPESPLSQHDPEEVMSAYNELVQLSPRLADQPSAIAPLLNKRLMGHTEPFEVGEILKLEQGLKQTQPPQVPADGAPKPAGKSNPNSTINSMKNEASILS